MTQKSRLPFLLFILFAPVTVPAYILFLIVSNVLAGAFYVVIEATLVPLMRRPIRLSHKQTALLAIPVLLAAPIATILLFALGLLRWTARIIMAVGHWQTSWNSPGAAFTAGLIWILVSAWVTLTCLNAVMGSSLIGRPLKGRDLFVDFLARDRTMKEFPPEMQVRRGELIELLDRQKEAAHPQWDEIVAALRDDEATFSMLSPFTQVRLTGIPWYFTPKERAYDGADHCQLLLGGLFFAAMVLIRWPGTFTLIRHKSRRGLWFVLRLVLALWAVYSLITWLPQTIYFNFFIPKDGPSLWFKILSPAFWMGLEPETFVRLEWYLLNTAMWLAIFGLASLIWWLAWRVSPFLGWPRYYVAFFAARLLQRKRIAFFSVGAVTLCVAMMIIVISVMGGFVDSIKEKAHGLLGDVIMSGGQQGFPYYQGFIDRIAKLKDEKTGQPIVVQATPLIHAVGILQFPRTKKTANVNIWGIRLNEYVRVNRFGDDLFYNNRYGGTRLDRQKKPLYGWNEQGFATLPDDMDANYQRYLASLSPAERDEEQKRYAHGPGDLYPGPGVFQGPTTRPGYEEPELPGVIIGRTIVARRQPSGEYYRGMDYPRGEVVLLTVVPMTRSGDISMEPPPKPRFRYVDDSRTGIHEIDSMNVYVDFEELQRLLSMDEAKTQKGSTVAARSSQIEINLAESFSKVNDRQTLKKYQRLIWGEWLQYVRTLHPDQVDDELLRLVDMQTWEEMQSSYISAIEKEKFLVLIMFGVISIVAVFLILCIFYMIVQEKTRDIGIIKSTGGSAAGVAAVFLVYGAAIGIVGSVLGSMLGISFVDHINDIQEGLARLNPDWRVWSPETYSFDQIPSAWKWSEVIGIGILAMCSAIAGAAFPAIRAGRTWPVETLRYE
jgi:lipoprotein-releasing system permease protein